MKPLRVCVMLFFGVLMTSHGVLYAQVEHDSTLLISKINCDWLYLEGGNLYQDIYFISSVDTQANINVRLYKKTNSTDSLIIFSIKGSGIKISKGINKLKLSANDRKVKSHFNPDWLNAFKSIDRAPVGKYQCIVDFETIHQYDKSSANVLLTSDTLIQGITKVDNQLSKVLGSNGIKVSNALENKSAYLTHYFKKKNITCQQQKLGDKRILDLYYGEWFLGRKELDGEITTNELAQTQKTLRSGLQSGSSFALEEYKSLQSQFKELQKADKEEAELLANISLSGNFSNGQEPNSNLPNNYYEGSADVSIPIFNIPVLVSGFYTTQDKERKAKASYVHFSYDSEKAKEQLMKLITGFNNKYNQALSSGSSYNLIYGKFVEGLNKEKAGAIASLAQECGVDKNDVAGLSKEQLEQMITSKIAAEANGLKDSLQKVADSSSEANQLNEAENKLLEAKAKSEEKYRKIMVQYNKIAELEAKIDHYRTLLDQYEKSNFYDSAMVYSKMNGLQDYENMSYKDMAKRASALLPEGKTKTMITGLVNFDAGMFPKYVSDYTMSGQMLKGLDASYDIGFGTIGGSYGKMEYIDREGNVEAYKAYSGRIQFKPVYKQEFGFVYYGYSPGKSLIEGSGFFKDASLSMPSFRNPVSIVSTTYKGAITDYVLLSGEYAYSNKPSQSEDAKAQIDFMSQSAYNVKAELLIPETNITLETVYEHAGSNFENNTLPVLLAGTDRLSVKGQGDFFKGFLTLGAEYNLLTQKSFSTEGSNTKWGFDIATHSKRYPSVALSYKPFSTFRSLNDTLNIAQKPIAGEVWTGKANYQIKKLDKAVRFTLIYNQNKSTNDTIKYSSSTWQFNTILSKKSTMLSLGVGHSNINTNQFETAYPLYNESYFMNTFLSGTIKEKIFLSGGIDMTKAGGGIAKYGCFISSGYSFDKLPFAIRTNFRYNNYKMEEVAGREQLVSGSITLLWKIKEKLYTD